MSEVEGGTTTPSRVVIVPGNGCAQVRDANWYGWLEDELAAQGIAVVLRNMPDPFVARESNWLPFMEKELQCSRDTVLVGHSSGAVAGLRYAETRDLGALIVVSGCVSDLGNANERASGYYNRPWRWDDINAHCGVIEQFASTDDPFIPISEMHAIRDGLALAPERYHEHNDRGHWMCGTFPELRDRVVALLQP